MKNLLEKVKRYEKEVAGYDIPDTEALEQFRIRFLGSKNVLKGLFKAIPGLGPSNRKQAGQLINALQQQAQEKYHTAKKALKKPKQEGGSGHDLTLPPEPQPLGSRHPLSIMHNRIVSTFLRLGFTISEGPEIEDDWHNFGALNIPPHHPARDMQDTFFLEKAPDMVLRTHTSSVQVRVMKEQRPPIRTISPGRVYRNETISARAHCQFHQVEGLYVDEGVSFADLKQTLYYFAREMFGAGTDIRFRPSYFPFTEPSAEMDISCLICEGKGCRLCKHTGWVEILGCGMVDPNVFEALDIDPEKFTGFAFGMGVERIAQLKYRVNDLRLYFENDLRFLKQFRPA